MTPDNRCHRKGIYAGLPTYPGDWKESYLGDLVDTNPETLGTGTPSDFTFRYIDLSSVSEGVTDWDTVQENTFRSAPSRARRCVRQHDVLFGTVRPSLRSHTTIGSVDGSPLVASTGFAVLRAGTKSCPGYIKHLIFSEPVAAQVRRLETGSNYPAVNESDLKKVLVPHPEDAEQARIAEVLDTLDDAIRGTESVLRKHQDCRDGLVQDLMRYGLTDLGEVRAPRHFPRNFVRSPLGSVPSTWRVGPLGDFITLQRGFDITQQEQGEGSVPVVSSSGVTSYHNKAMVKAPGVVIGRKGKLGGAHYLEIPFWPHDTTLWVKDFHGNSPEFCAHFLRQMRLERFDAATSVPTLNRNFVHPISVAFPGVCEQERICQVLRAADDELRRESELLKKLKSLKSGLTSNLLTGCVRTVHH